MTITIPPFTPGDGALSGMPNITPFTYRDGQTYLQRLERLKKYIERVLVPWVQENYDELAEAFTDTVNALIQQVNTAIESIINDSVEVQDSVMAAIIADVESATRIALDNLYAGKTDFDSLSLVVENIVTIVETGRLSPDNLDAMYAAKDEVYTKIESTGLFPVYRVKSGGTYPPRIDGALNIFFGDTDPGLAMSATDYWADPNTTTLAETTAEVGNTASALHAAVRLAASELPFIVFDANALEQETGGTLVRSIRGASPNQHAAWGIPSTGVSRLYAGFKVPIGWSSIMLRVWFYHDQAGGSGNVVFTSTVSGYANGTLIASGVSKNLTVAALANGVVTEGLTDFYPVTAGQFVSIMFARNGGAATDTLEYPINLIALAVERVA